MTKMTSAQDVYLKLRAMILNLDIRPGSRLTESQLAEYFDVSRTPIRAALQRLENEKQVVIRPKQGCFIRDIDIMQISQYYDVRVQLEGLVLEELIQQKDRQTLNELLHLWDPAHKFFGEVINEDLKLAEESFHIQLAAATHNAPLCHYIADISDQIRVVRHLGWPNQNSVSDTYNEHYLVLDMLLKGHLADAKSEMTNHIRKSQDLANRVTLQQLYRNKNMITFE